MIKPSFIGIVRHDGRRAWVIPESKTPEKLKAIVKPCVWRPKEYACDIVKKMFKGETNTPNHIHYYDCLDCLRSQHDLKTIQKLLKEHMAELNQGK